MGAGFERAGSSTAGAAVPLSEGAAGVSMVAGEAPLAVIGGCTAVWTRGCSSMCWGSATATADDPLCSVEEDSGRPWTRLRMISATGSSMELEWVFFSVTPTSVNTSRIDLLFTLSSRAKSLIRIFIAGRRNYPESILPDPQNLA